MTLLPAYPNETHTIEGDDWHELRLRNIGGSEIAGLFDMEQPYQLSRYGLYMVKSKQAKDDFEGNERTEWGNRLEAAIAHGIAEDNGWTIRKGGYFADPETPGLGSTLDYIIESDPEFEGPGALEIKNVDGMVFRDKWVDDEPPEHILLQLQHQLAASGFQWGAIGALVNGNTTHVYKYAARPNLIAEIRRRVNQFWQDVRDGVVPPIDGSDNSKRIAQAINTPVKIETVDRSDDPAFAEVCREYEETRLAVKEAQEKHNLAKNRLIAVYGGVKQSEGNGWRVTVSVTAAKPDRVAKPGEIILGRAETRRYTVKEI